MLNFALVQLNFDQISVDFVNLRTETYTEDSRIPTVGMGSPKQDALRRDLTINSLFYNIHTNTVEDFTGKGTNALMIFISFLDIYSLML